MTTECSNTTDGFTCTRDRGHGGWCEHENERGEIDHRWKITATRGSACSATRGSLPGRNGRWRAGWKPRPPVTG